MHPMFLPEVEEGNSRGAYASMINALRAAGSRGNGLREIRPTLYWMTREVNQ
jgi:hypothetical protein